jgi:hypothetical protein
MAIPTLYNGYHFRSRLEAKWAVFMDVLDVGWRYEPEGYVVGGEPYLPDFYLPGLGAGLGAFLEIKPTAPVSMSRADRVAQHLADNSGKMVYVQIGPLVAVERYGTADTILAEPTDAWARAYFPETGADEPYLWCECPLCGCIDLSFDGRAARNYCRCYHDTNEDKQYNWRSARLLDAYEKARNMRFEHRA